MKHIQTSYSPKGDMVPICRHVSVYGILLEDKPAGVQRSGSLTHFWCNECQEICTVRINELNYERSQQMLGKTLVATWLIIDKWWWKLFMLTTLFYCIWLFANAVDAHLTHTMNYWNQNLGM